MKERAARIPLGRRIAFAGFRSDIPQILSAMDLFVLASVSEGFPNVLLEAMAAGKPVVATRVGGVPELIEHGRDGVLVDPADAAGLADAVLSLMKDPARARTLGENAGKKVRRDFTLESMVDQYEKMYASMLGSSPAPREFDLSGVS
jgi:glycosyltransferase involved in cell wall biosynthesis